MKQTDHTQKPNARASQRLPRRPEEASLTLARLPLGEIVVGALPTTPTRLTMSAPSDNTQLSLGAKKGERIEAGITGRTDHHIHFVTHDPDESTGRAWNQPLDWLDTDNWKLTIQEELDKHKRTLVSLGDPTKLDPHDDETWNDTFKTKLRGDTELSPTRGHTVYTTGASYHYAEQDCRIVSTDGNVLVRTRSDHQRLSPEYLQRLMADTADKCKKLGASDELAWAIAFMDAIKTILSPPPAWASLYSDSGTAQVMGGGEVSIGSRGGVSIVASKGAAMPDPGGGLDYDGVGIVKAIWEGDPWRTFTGSVYYTGSVFKSMNSIANTVTSLVGLVSTIHHAVKWKSLVDLPAWAPYPNLAMRIVLGITGLVCGAVNACTGFLGDVSLYADHNINAVGMGAATVYGGSSCSISSALAASVNGLNSSMLGTFYAGVTGGLEAGLTGGFNASVTAQWGKASVSGGLKGIELTAVKGAAALAALKNVEVKSTAGKTVVHGTTGALVSAGTGVGYAMQVTPTKIRLGAVPVLVPLSQASVQQFPWVHIDMHAASLKAGVTEVKTSLASTEIKGPLVDIKGDATVKINGTLVQLG